MLNRYPLQEFEKTTGLKPLKGNYTNPTKLSHHEIKKILISKNNHTKRKNLWENFTQANPELLSLHNSLPEPNEKDQYHILFGVISEFPVDDIRHYCTKIKNNIFIDQDTQNYTPLEKMLQKVATWRIGPEQLNYLTMQTLWEETH